MLIKNETLNKFYFNGKEITEAEYNNIFEIIQNKPIPPNGFGYKLTAELEWELYELPVIEESEDVSAEDALAELMEVLS